MAKEKSEKSNVEETASKEMVASCKKEARGFKSRDEFLVSVWAKKPDGSISTFPNSDMHKYEAMFVSKHCATTSDAFIFDKLARRKERKYDDKFDTDTGWFAPSLFWNQILNS